MSPDHLPSPDSSDRRGDAAGRRSAGSDAPGKRAGPVAGGKQSASPSRRPRVIVTIDGPAGTGKSTVAHRLAQRLGLEFLDTGAMYRAITLLVLEDGGDPHDPRRVTQIARDASLRFDFDRDPPELLADGRVLGESIRSSEVTASVSIVAAHPGVREAMVASQRAIAESHPRLVTEGRDQGSVVFPDADVKFYLDAKPEIRAVRRADQLRRKGEHADVASILTSIVERDTLDATRSTGRLMRPADAIYVDTGELDVGGVVERLESLARPLLKDLIEVGAGESL